MNLYWNTPKTVFRFDETLEGIIYDRVNGVFVFRQGDQVIPPSYKSPLEPVVTLDSVKFGDGYEQLTEAGINPTQLSTTSSLTTSVGQSF